MFRIRNVLIRIRILNFASMDAKIGTYKKFFPLRIGNTGGMYNNWGYNQNMRINIIELPDSYRYLVNPILYTQRSRAEFFLAFMELFEEH